MKKFLSALAMSVALLFTLTAAAMLVGCSDGPMESGGSKAGGKTSIYGIYKAGDQTWFINESDAAEALVEGEGDEFTSVDAKMSPEECLKAVDNAIANQASGIVVCVPDQTMSQAVVDRCKQNNVPVIACDDALEVDGKKIAPWVGVDAYAIGVANGEWLANYAKDNKLANDPDVGFLCMTMDTVSSCVPRAVGVMDKWNEILPNFAKDKIFKADYDGTTDKGNAAASAVFTAHPEIKKWLVTGVNEEGAIGACRALESAGLDKNATVVGVGAYMAKDEWNNKGAKGTCMKASAYFSAEEVGKDSIDVIEKMIDGEEPPMETAVSTTMVTPDNYRQVMGKYAN